MSSTLSLDVVAAVIEALWVGCVATLATDLWGRLLQAFFGLPLAQWGLVGRWVATMSRGVFVHRAIAATPPVRGERAIGWGFHYAVGVLYAGLYLIVLRWLGSEPTLISAIVFSLALLIAPWFVMQPALGLGFVAARAPRPGVTRAVNVTSHTAFAVGLYGGAVASPLIVNAFWY